MYGWYRCIFVIIVVWNDVTCSGEYVPKCELSHDEVYYRPTFSTQIHPRLNRWSCVFFFLSPCSLLSFYVSDSYRSVLIRSLNKTLGSKVFSVLLRFISHSVETIDVEFMYSLSGAVASFFLSLHSKFILNTTTKAVEKGLDS